jgi:hypothetical protein
MVRSLRRMPRLRRVSFRHFNHIGYNKLAIIRNDADGAELSGSGRLLAALLDSIDNKGYEVLSWAR